MITLREKVANVVKYYEEQATVKRVAAVPAKSIKPIGKGSNHESQA
jgi:hypothetical protein